MVPVVLTAAVRREWLTGAWTEESSNVVHVQLLGTNLAVREETMT